ncbi:MAG: hypothetical protein AB1805_09160 [Nitrospirota bacterium]
MRRKELTVQTRSTMKMLEDYGLSAYSKVSYDCKVIVDDRATAIDMKCTALICKN